jgi:hypothetical protein
MPNRVEFFDDVNTVRSGKRILISTIAVLKELPPSGGLRPILNKLSSKEPGMALKPGMMCSCQIPVPLLHMGEDTGMCKTCNLVYDERLYEMRIRQHVSDWHYDNLHQWFEEVSPFYQSLPAR